MRASAKGACLKYVAVAVPCSALPVLYNCLSFFWPFWKTCCTCCTCTRTYAVQRYPVPHALSILLLQLYENLIKDIEDRIKPESLVTLVQCVIGEITDVKDAIAFLEPIKEKVRACLLLRRRD